MMLVYVTYGQTCQTYACGTIKQLPEPAPQWCVFTDTGATTTNVASCKTGSACALTPITIFTMPKLDNAACAANPAPTPTPVTNIVPGDVCNSANGDSCNKGKCVSSICVSDNKADAACTADADCGLGLWCKASKCAAIVAPGGACTPLTSVT